MNGMGCPADAGSMSDPVFDVIGEIGQEHSEAEHSPRKSQVQGCEVVSEVQRRNPCKAGEHHRQQVCKES